MTPTLLSRTTVISIITSISSKWLISGIQVMIIENKANDKRDNDGDNHTNKDNESNDDGITEKETDNIC